MRPSSEFTNQVEDAYAHLYDLVYLRTQALAGLLVPDQSLNPKEKAWQLHHLLLEVIADLRPDAHVPVASRPWRRHQLMTSRYVRAMDIEAVLNELGISRRTFYREHRIAVEALATSLWTRLSTPLSDSTELAPTMPSSHEPLAHLEILRLETARLVQAGRFARVGAVVEGALTVMGKMLRQHDIEVHTQIPEALPSVSVDENLLRQLLLSVLEYLIEPVQHGTMRLTASAQATTVHLSAHIEPDAATRQVWPIEAEAKMQALQELAALSSAQMSSVRLGSSIIACDLQLPVAERTVLVVDDNEDVLELFRRYLSAHPYHVVTARTAQDALALARQLKPYAITLDLMMPGQDGWDLLQTLLTQPETDHIPVIVCSVLKQKALALSLGATAFLDKPVSEQAILGALQALQAG